LTVKLCETREAAA
jgi:hypothetical protein